MLVIESKHVLSHKPSNLVNIPCHSKTRALRRNYDWLEQKQDLTD